MRVRKQISSMEVEFVEHFNLRVLENMESVTGMDAKYTHHASEIAGMLTMPNEATSILHNALECCQKNGWCRFGIGNMRRMYVCTVRTYIRQRPTTVVGNKARKTGTRYQVPSITINIPSPSSHITKRNATLESTL